jgi:YidC/Oxa1 family membrane protein insertase
MQVIQPEPGDPLSLLMTLDQLGGLTIPRDSGITFGEADGEDGALVGKVAPESPAARAGLQPGDRIVAVDLTDVERAADFTEILTTVPTGSRLVLTIVRDGAERELSYLIQAELPDLDLRDGYWELESSDAEQVTFLWRLPRHGLEVVKRFRLTKAAGQNGARPDGYNRAFHLVVDLELRNVGQQEIKDVAYQFDGPTGLPTEGWWYTNKISRTWSGIGIRDVAVHHENDNPLLIPPQMLVGDQKWVRWTDQEKGKLLYLGVDAQYFAAVLLPSAKSPMPVNIAESMPLRASRVPKDKARWRLLDVSTRIVSQPVDLQPGASLRHEYTFFVGPKKPDLLARYGLSELLYYGWFGFVAVPMLWILHFFHSIVGNYGLAIIMLTVLVRGCMFPLSRKQALSAQKMQELQPEIKKLAEKYKNNLEARNKAQRELFQKHNYNPLGGCALMFVQLPIFIGLYRSLMVDVELHQAPLIPGLDWCSNLAAPDMLFHWESWMPAFLASETGYLGPYFNLLPIFTIALFIVQQKMFMPPPADEQAALQQKMMKYMMVFMGFLFFKVASGLCIYFIASSLWGIAERKLLPKVTPPPAPEKKTAEPVAARANFGAGSNGSQAARRKKQRRK